MTPADDEKVKAYTVDDLTYEQMQSYIRKSEADRDRMKRALEVAERKLVQIVKIKTLPDHSLNTFNMTMVHILAEKALTEIEKIRSGKE